MEHAERHVFEFESDESDKSCSTGHVSSFVVEIRVCTSKRLTCKNVDGCSTVLTVFYRTRGRRKETRISSGRDCTTTTVRKKHNPTYAVRKKRGGKKAALARKRVEITKRPVRAGRSADRRDWPPRCERRAYDTAAADAAAAACAVATCSTYRPVTGVCVCCRFRFPGADDATVKSFFLFFYFQSIVV